MLVNFFVIPKYILRSSSNKQGATQATVSEQACKFENDNWQSFKQSNGIFVTLKNCHDYLLDWLSNQATSFPGLSLPNYQTKRG